MATVPNSISGSPRGITNTLSGFVIESESITEAPVQEDFDDQTGARADEQVYDTRYDLRLTIYGASNTASIGSVVADFSSSDKKQGKKIVYAGKNWKVDNCEEAGSYNGRRRWNISAHRYNNYPAQGSQGPAQGSNGSSQGA